MDITQRFLNYTQFDTQSSEDSQSVPSTPKQLVFAQYLKKELEDEGLSDVEMDENGYTEGQYQEKNSYHWLYFTL